jgi:transposase
MQAPLLARTLTDTERQQLTASLRSADAFTMRRAQIVLASVRQEHVPQIARSLGCSEQCVREALHAFNAVGLAALSRRSTRPHTDPAAFSPAHAEQLKALLHQSPRTFGRPTSLWTLDLAAQVSFEKGLTAELVTGETVRATLARLGVKWKRAKRWITSPDPAYARKKGQEIA